MKHILIAGLAAAALSGCATMGASDSQSAYNSCESVSDIKARQQCVETAKAAMQAERLQNSADILKEAQEYEDRYARERAMGVPKDKAGRRAADSLPDF